MAGAWMMAIIFALISYFVFNYPSEEKETENILTERNPMWSFMEGSGEMFDRVAENYDLINWILSMGKHQQWRRYMLDSLNLKDTDTLLDLATGTGDVAIMVMEEYKCQRVLAIDPSRKMLDKAKIKIEKAGLSKTIELIEGNAEDMSFIANGSIEKITVAFGIRNFANRDIALKEISRISRRMSNNDKLVPSIAFLELAASDDIMPGITYFVRYGVPFIGGLISGLFEEYDYLKNSMLRFPSKEKFKEQIEMNDMKVIRIDTYMFGLVNLFIVARR